MRESFKGRIDGCRRMARREFKAPGISAEKPGGGMESLRHHDAEVCRSLVVLDVAN